MDLLYNSLNQSDLRQKRKRRTGRVNSVSQKIQKYSKTVQRKRVKEEEIFMEE